MDKIKRFLNANWILLVILLTAFFFRAYNLDVRVLATDEDHSIRFANESLEGKLDVILSTEPHPPGYYLFLGSLLKLTNSVYFARIVNVIIGVLGILVLYLLINIATSNKNLALLSSFLLAINPMHIIYSSQLRSYTLLSLIYLLSSLLLYKYIFKNYKKYIYAIVPLYIISFYLHFYSIFLVASHILTVLWFRKRISFKHYIYGILIFTASILLYIPRLIKQINYTIIDAHLPFKPLSLVEVLYPLYKQAVMVNISAMGETKYIAFIFVLLLSLIFVYGIYKLYRTDVHYGLFFSFIFFSVFLISLLADQAVSYLSGGKTTIYYFRYFTYLSPLYTFFIANGINTRNKFIKYLLLSIIIAGWISIIIFYYRISAIPDWSRYIGV